MQTRLYKSGSIIYFLGDKADRIFLLKDGTLQRIFISTETGREDRKTITAGNFFSVKSVMGMHAQEETIQCLSDVNVIIFTQSEFEELVSKNTSVLLKILGIFSEQFRDLNKSLDSVLDTDKKDNKSASANKKDGLNTVADYFFKNKRYKEALHGYSKFLKTENPESTLYTAAALNMEECMKALSITEPVDVYFEKLEQERIDKAKEFLANNESSVEGKFRKASGFSVLGDHPSAITLLREIISSGNEEVLEKASFYLGKYLFLNKEYDEALSVLDDVISKSQLSDYSKETSLYLARIYAMNGNDEEAMKYYKKTINIPPIDKFTMEAKREYDSLRG